ncbi:MAG: septum formation inhibitor Maf [Gammaproteobacteria bacterium]|nr:septum formation inhibitor Maf [Gammaproteobacteria bacterium]
MKLVLASSSPFRKQLLEKLQLEFDCYSPDIDETHLTEESPPQLIQRLSLAKAVKVAEQYPEALIIGSDQVAVHNKKILGKPGNQENAIAQLTSFSGEIVHFITGICLYNASCKQHQYYQDDTFVSFRDLKQSEIVHYLQTEKPYQCAGSFMSEGLGIALLHYIESKDPNALIGLPLIKLVQMLKSEGVNALG